MVSDELIWKWENEGRHRSLWAEEDKPPLAIEFLRDFAAAVEKARDEDCPECGGKGFVEELDSRGLNEGAALKMAKCPDPLCGKHGAKPGKMSKIALTRDAALEEAAKTADELAKEFDDRLYYGVELEVCKDLAADIRALKSTAITGVTEEATDGE